jgi:hypothetical protein
VRSDSTLPALDGKKGSGNLISMGNAAPNGKKQSQATKQYLAQFLEKAKKGGLPIQIMAPPTPVGKRRSTPAGPTTMRRVGRTSKGEPESEERYSDRIKMRNPYLKSIWNDDKDEWSNKRPAKFDVRKNELKPAVARNRIANQPTDSMENLNETGQSNKGRRMPNALPQQEQPQPKQQPEKFELKSTTSKPKLKPKATKPAGAAKKAGAAAAKNGAVIQPTTLSGLDFAMGYPGMAPTMDPFYSLPPPPFPAPFNSLFPQQQQQMQPNLFMNMNMNMGGMKPSWPSIGLGQFMQDPSTLSPQQQQQQQQQQQAWFDPSTMQSLIPDPSFPQMALQQPAMNQGFVNPNLIPARIRMTQVPVMVYKQALVIEATGEAPGTYHGDDVAFISNVVFQKGEGAMGMGMDAMQMMMGQQPMQAKAGQKLKAGGAKAGAGKTGLVKKGGATAAKRVAGLKKA